MRSTDSPGIGRARTSCPGSPPRSSPGEAPTSVSSRWTRERCQRRSGARDHASSRSANLFRDQLDRYGELELVAERWRSAVERLHESTTLVVNADDPILAELAEGHDAVLRFGLDDPRHARPSLQHAADSKYCVRCGHPYEYAAAYVGHLGDYRCPACGHERPPLDVAAREIELVGLSGSRFRLDTPLGSVVVELSLPGLYNVYNAVAAASLATALGHESRGDLPRARRLQRCVRPVRADPRRGEDDRRSPDQEPGRGERGTAHARDRSAARPRDRAERRYRRRSGRLVDLGRGLRAAPPPRRTSRRKRASGRPSSACVSSTAGCRRIDSR